MLLSPFAQLAIAQARRQDFEREVQAHRARRIARDIIAACCAWDATAAATLESARLRRSRVWLDLRTALKGGA